MAVVLKTVAFGASRREGQDRIQAVQGLNGRLLIEAEYGRVPRRIQVQTDDWRLHFELGIVAGHVSFEAMRLEAGASCQTRCTASLLTSSAEASLRQLQCVEPSLGFLRVADKIRARRAGG